MPKPLPPQHRTALIRVREIHRPARSAPPAFADNPEPPSPPPPLAAVVLEGPCPVHALLPGLFRLLERVAWRVRRWKCR
jgi:hypothetical protein